MRKLTRLLIFLLLSALALLPLVAAAQEVGVSGGPKRWAFSISVLTIIVTERKCSADHPELAGMLETAFADMQRRNAKIVPLEIWKGDGLTIDYINSELYKNKAGPTAKACSDFAAHLGDPAFDRKFKQIVDEARQERLDEAEQERNNASHHP